MKPHLRQYEFVWKNETVKKPKLISNSDGHKYEITRSVLELDGFIREIGKRQKSFDLRQKFIRCKPTLILSRVNMDCTVNLRCLRTYNKANGNYVGACPTKGSASGSETSSHRALNVLIFSRCLLPISVMYLSVYSDMDHVTWYNKTCVIIITQSNRIRILRYEKCSW